MLSRRNFFTALAGAVAAATVMPTLEKAMAAVEPMVARASRWGGAYLDMASANAMLKELYSPDIVNHFACDGPSLLGMAPAP